MYRMEKNALRTSAVIVVGLIIPCRLCRAATRLFVSLVVHGPAFFRFLPIDCYARWACMCNSGGCDGFSAWACRSSFCVLAVLCRGTITC